MAIGLSIIIVSVCFVGFFLAGIRIVRPVERAIIERLGKYHKFCGAGFHWIIPIIDKIGKINITERMADVEPQDIITKDNLNARVDLVVYYKVMENEDNVKKSVYNVDDFETQIISLAKTTARNVIGDMGFSDVNNKRNQLNDALGKVLDRESDAWGVQIVRVELKEITPPEDVQETMNRVIKANNEKEAALDFATAAETKADGVKRAAIKEAEGIAKGKVIVAEGEAKRIELVNVAANKYFIKNAKKQKSSKANKILAADSRVRRIYLELRKTQEFSPDNLIHPKYQVLVKVLLDELHRNSDARVLVFVKLRNSVKNIVTRLKGVKKIKPVRFVGQATKS
ncbi:hypothetical protein LCGC14_1399430, partial [marine sediment metagenome]